jgi:hypothetical protein
MSELKNALNYYPMWYERNRPFSRRVGGAVMDKGLTTQSMQMIQGLITSKWNECLLQKVIEPEFARTDVVKEISLAMYFGAYCSSGKQLFQLTEMLEAMLKNTVADEIPIGAIRSPYESYFIQFHNAVMWEGKPIIGAYIIDNNQVNQLQVCLVIAPQDPLRHWMSSPAGYFYVPLNREKAEVCLGELIDTSIHSEIVLKWEHATKSMPLIEESGMIDKRTQRAKRESMDLSSAKVAIKEALSLIANALCYLTSDVRDASVSYPSDASPSLIDKMENGATPKIKAKAEIELKKHGYLPVTYIGNKLTDGGAVSNSGNGVREHWRRGHWRNQAYGDSRSERRLVWIKPTLVGSDKSSNSVESEQTRLYKVKSAD